MCEPTTLMAISVGLSAAAAGATVIGQQQQYRAQKDAAMQQQENIRQNTVNQYDTLALVRQQEIENASQKVQQNMRQALKAKATATTAAGEAGVSGVSVNALLQELNFQEGEYASSVTTNLNRRTSQLDREAEGIRIGGQSQINSISEPVAPDYAGAALRLGGSVLDSYNRYLHVPKGKT